MFYTEINLNNTPSFVPIKIAGAEGEAYIKGLKFTLPSGFEDWSVSVDIKNANNEKYKGRIASVVDGIALYEFSNKDLSAAGKLFLDLVLTHGKQIYKPFMGEFTVRRAICPEKSYSEPEDIPSDLVTQITENTLYRHEHLNSIVLDNFSQDENGSLLYNGNPIGVSKVDEEQLKTCIKDALVEAKESGEFNGKDGESVEITDIVDSDEYDGYNVVTFSNGRILSIKNGSKGASAYEIAVANGFLGSESEWLESLNGAPGKGLTEQQLKDLAANTEAKHTHLNKIEVLDKLTLDEKGDLLFDGKSIKAENVSNNENVNPKATMAQTVTLLLESSEIYVSVEAPDVASKEESDFAGNLLNTISGYHAIYAPPQDGELTYIDLSTYEPVKIDVFAGYIYIFYIDMEAWELKRISYVGSGILDFFKSKILEGYLTEEQIEEKIRKAIQSGGGVVVETDPTVPDWAKEPEPPKYNASEITYTNAIFGGEVDNVKSGLDQAVSYVMTELPRIEKKIDDKTVPTKEEIVAAVLAQLPKAEEDEF